MKTKYNNYNLELEKVVSEIKQAEAKKVCLQLPDGLKPKAKEIVDDLKKELPDVEFIIWADSCFGACDLALEAEKIGADMLVHFGHSEMSGKW